MENNGKQIGELSRGQVRQRRGKLREWGETIPQPLLPLEHHLGKAGVIIGSGNAIKIRHGKIS